jgi:hypothetical protein
LDGLAHSVLGQTYGCFDSPTFIASDVFDGPEGASRMLGSQLLLNYCFVFFRLSCIKDRSEPTSISPTILRINMFASLAFVILLQAAVLPAVLSLSLPGRVPPTI